MPTYVDQREVKDIVKNILQFFQLKHGRTLNHLSHEEIKEIAQEAVDSKVKDNPKKHAAVGKVLSAALRQLGITKRNLALSTTMTPPEEVREKPQPSPKNQVKTYKVRRLRR